MLLLSVCWYVCDLHGSNGLNHAFARLFNRGGQPDTVSRRLRFRSSLAISARLTAYARGFAPFDGWTNVFWQDTRLTLYRAGGRRRFTVDVIDKRRSIGRRLIGNGHLALITDFRYHSHDRYDSNIEYYRMLVFCTMPDAQIHRMYSTVLVYFTTLSLFLSVYCWNIYGGGRLCNTANKNIILLELVDTKTFLNFSSLLKKQSTK